MQRLDKVWERLGIVSKTEKASDRVLSGTALGIDLIERTELQPKSTRLVELLLALIDLLKDPTCTRKQLSSYLGSWQWVLLLNRPLLSCLHRIYGYTENVDDPVNRTVPRGVLSELCHITALSCCLSNGLGKDWCAFLYATDGAMVYGLGGSEAPCSPAEARDVAAAAGNPSCVFYPRDAATSLRREKKVRPSTSFPLAWDPSKLNSVSKRRESRMRLSLRALPVVWRAPLGDEKAVSWKEGCRASGCSVAVVCHSQRAKLSLLPSSCCKEDWS